MEDISEEDTLLEDILDTSVKDIYVDGVFVEIFH